MLVLFTSPVFAEGLTLSLSDPELGSLVLKKENPVKTTCPQGVGGLSLGKFTYKGEWLGVVFYLGNKYPMQYATPPGRYDCDCDKAYIIYDKVGGFALSSLSSENEKMLCSAAEIDLSPEASAARIDKTNKNWREELNNRRGTLVDAMAPLLEKYFDQYPEWQPELGFLIRQKGSYERIKQLSQAQPPQGVKDGCTLATQMYKGNFLDLPSVYHSATCLLGCDGQGFFWAYSYPNHGRSYSEPGMGLYCTASGWGYLPYAYNDLNCSTDYGAFSGQHVCNDDTILQKYYVCTNGEYPSTTGQCCSDSYLNTKAPACSCAYNKSSRGLAIPVGDHPVAIPVGDDPEPAPAE
jgi:hypothetical protein